jgi:hypothetical protein
MFKKMAHYVALEYTEMTHDNINICRNMPP